VIVTGWLSRQVIAAKFETMMWESKARILETRLEFLEMRLARLTASTSHVND
jgi:hypothetical protein